MDSKPHAKQLDPLAGINRGKVIMVTYLIAAMDITWMFLQFSITPYLAKRLGFDTLWFGYLQTTVGVIQLLGGPIFGRFADLFGARAALSVSCMASVVFYSLLAVTNSTLLLFLHKLPTVLMHGLPGAQMVVADLTEPTKRADALAKLGLCFGVGMITGSTLGGTLSTRFGESFAASFAAVGSFISLLLVLNFIPKHTKAQSTQQQSSKDRSVFNLADISRLMKYPGVAKTFIVKIIVGLPAGIFQVMFSVIAMNVFELEAEQNGYLMAYFGVMQMIMQGAVIGQLTSRYSDSSMLLLSVAVESLVGLGLALMSNVFQFCIIVIPMMFALSMFGVITDSMLTKSVPSSDTGTMMGLCASVQSLQRTIGPTIGGFVYESYGVPSFGVIQFSVNIVVLMFLYLGVKSEIHKE